MLLVFERHGELLLRQSELIGFHLDIARALWHASDDELLSQSCPVDESRAETVSRYCAQPLDLKAYDYVVEFDPNRGQIRSILDAMIAAIQNYRSGNVPLARLTAELRSRVAAVEDMGGTPWGRQLRSKWRRLSDESDAVGASPVAPGKQREAIEHVLDDLEGFLAKH